MRLSSRQRMRWRECVLEILPHAAFCCVYPACPLQRQQHRSKRESFTLSRICAVLPALRQMQHQLFPGPLKSDNEMGKRWNADGFFWQNRWCEIEEHKGRRGDGDEEKSLSFLCTKKVLDLRCWEAFCCTSILISLTGVYHDQCLSQFSLVQPRETDWAWKFLIINVNFHHLVTFYLPYWLKFFFNVKYKEIYLPAMTSLKICEAIWQRLTCNCL